MKTLLILLIPTFLVGCTATGAFDADGFTKAVTSVTGAYQATQQPHLVGYDQAGNPVYR